MSLVKWSLSRADGLCVAGSWSGRGICLVRRRRTWRCPCLMIPIEMAAISLLEMIIGLKLPRVGLGRGRMDDERQRRAPVGGRSIGGRQYFGRWSGGGRREAGGVHEARGKHTRHTRSWLQAGTGLTGGNNEYLVQVQVRIRSGRGRESKMLSRKQKQDHASQQEIQTNQPRTTGTATAAATAVSGGVGQQRNQQSNPNTLHNADEGYVAGIKWECGGRG